PPADATNVDLKTSIAIEFSQAMNQASVTVTLSPTVALGAPVWTGNIVTLTPTGMMAPNQTYTMSVTGQDAGGMALAGTKTFMFKTLTLDTTAPTVTGTSPANNATGVATNAALSVT